MSRRPCLSGVSPLTSDLALVMSLDELSSKRQNMLSGRLVRGDITWASALLSMVVPELTSAGTCGYGPAVCLPDPERPVIEETLCVHRRVQYRFPSKFPKH